MPTPEPEDFQTRLVLALSEQTAAMHRLAESNEGLVEAIAQLVQELDLGSDETPSHTYLDGTPVR